jgi:hypothetical protein
MARPPNPSAPLNYVVDEETSVGRQAIRVFRAARRRRLALSADQLPCLSPGLVAELLARAWDVPPELHPDDEQTTLEEPKAPSAV